MASFVLRRSNFFAQALKNSAYRSPAAVASNGKDTVNASITDDNLLPTPSSPFYVPVATRYMKGRRRWKFLPKLMGEDHVDPDMHARHSFEQRLRAIKQAENDESLHRVHDVGYPRVEARARRVEKAKELREARKRMKADAEMERASRLRQLEVDPVECEMEDVSSGEGEDFDVAKNAARHYGVFRDLYGRHAVFSNVVHLDVSFATGVEDADGDETVAPVFYGNFIDAVHCAKAPQLEIHAGDEKYADSLWTLVMTSPDQNFAQSNNEFLHLMIGNIRGSDVSSGSVVVPYFPPFPMRGFGPLRYVLVLYKQDAVIDFSAVTDVNFSDENAALALRSFSSYQFLRQHQDTLTPASQCFFQSTYDDSVKSVFYDRLDMKEPSYNYDWPEPARPPQYKFLENTSFNEYLDLYRDRKDINEQVLKERLSMMISPFDGYPKPEPWPYAKPPDEYNHPTWLQDELEEKKLRRGKWRDLEIRD